MIDNTFIAAYGGYVRKYIAYRVQNKQDAEDIYQEVWIKAIKKQVKYDVARAGHITWLTVLIKNAISEYYSKEVERQISLDASWGEEEGNDLLGHDLVEEEIPVKYSKEEVEKALNTLPFLQSMVLQLRLMEGMPHQEIAIILDIKHGQSRLLCHKGLKALKTLLA